MTTVLNAPTKAEQKVARHTISELEKISDKELSTNHFSFQWGNKNESLAVPVNLIPVLKVILGNLAAGKAVQISTVETELSTQEAANMLGISRPFLVKLLEQGKIPFKKVGTHRRIELKDIEAYERKQAATREKSLDFLTKQAQDLQLGYDEP